MNEPQDLKFGINRLTESIKELKDLISSSGGHYVVFECSSVKKVDEQDALLFGVKEINVNYLTDARAKYIAINSFSRFYQPDDISTRYVYRCPGFIVIEKNQREIEEHCIAINKQKDNIALIWQDAVFTENPDGSLKKIRRRDYKQAHEFIHTTLPGLMTEHVSRHIHFTTSKVKSFWCNFTSRPVPITMSQDETLAFLDRLKDKPRELSMSFNEWDAHLSLVQDQVKELSVDHAFQRLKYNKLFPSTTYSYFSEDKVKRRNVSLSLPLLLLGNDGAPKYSPLKSYTGEISNSKSRASNKLTLCPYSELVAVKKQKS